MLMGTDKPTETSAAEANNTASNMEQYMQMSVSKSALRNAGPAVASMIMVLIYNLADTFFIGLTQDALLVAAVSYATPIFLLFMALGSVFGMGGTSLISRMLGRNNMKKAKQANSFCMWACIGSALVMSALALIFMDQVVALSGSTAEAWNATETYLTIVTFGGVFVVVSNCCSNTIRAEGDPRTAMMDQILGNLINVILDPIMILALGWGIAGAAVATVIGNLFAACYYFSFYMRKKSSLGISIRNFTVGDGIASGVLSIGIPASLGSLLMSVSNIIMNQLMAGYGDMAVAGTGVAMKITMITATLSMGFAMGIQPLLGYCVGARNWDRFKSYMKFSSIASLIFSSALTVLCFIFVDQIVGVFLYQEEAIAYAGSFTRILLTTCFIIGPFFMYANALQAMGAAKEATVVNLSRQGIIYIPMLFILSSFMGAYGLMWSQPVADVLSTTLVIVLYRHRLKKMQSESMEVTTAVNPRKERKAA